MQELSGSGTATALTALAAQQATDASIVQASWQDPAVFGVLYDRYAAQLYRYAFRRLGEQLAEDAVADTFTAAFARRAHYDLSYDVARSWLFGILTKEIASQRRREVSQLRALARVHRETADESLADKVSADVTARAVRSRLAAALAGLSTGDRHVLLLIAWGDLSYEEVAQALGIPVGTVRSRLNRARLKIRGSLGEVNPIHAYGEEQS